MNDRRSPYAVDGGNRCPVDRSILRPDGRCSACGYTQRAPHPPRIVVDGLVVDAPLFDVVSETLKVEDYVPRRESDTPDVLEASRITDTPVIPSHLVCVVCLKPCASNAGLAAHRRAKHKVSVNG